MLIIYEYMEKFDLNMYKEYLRGTYHKIEML